MLFIIIQQYFIELKIAALKMKLKINDKQSLTMKRKETQQYNVTDNNGVSIVVRLPFPLLWQQISYNLQNDDFLLLETVQFSSKN